jgi:hypothetical protein
MAERSEDLIIRVLAGLLVASLIWTGVSLLGKRSARADLDQRDRWATKLAEVQAAIHPTGGVIDEPSLDRALHTLEIILPEVEAEEASDLVTVRDAMEASLKVRNRSMADSLRPEERGEGIAELRDGMARLMPQLTDDHQRMQAALASRSLIAMIALAVFAIVTIATGVRFAMVRRG